MDDFTVYEGSGFQELYQVHNFGQSIERAQLFQEVVRLYRVHWSDSQKTLL
jgi:hypothetical protein